MHDLKRHFAAASIVALAGLAALSVSNDSAAQTIEPYYADTSSYDAPAFHVTDVYPQPESTCLFDSGQTFTVEGTRIRLALVLSPSPSCDVPGGRSGLIVDRDIGRAEPLPAGEYTVEFGYLIDGEWVFRKSTSLVVDDGIDKCSRIPESNILIVSTGSQSVADRLAAVAINPALDPVLHERLGRPFGAQRYSTFAWVNLIYAPLDDIHDIKRRIDAVKGELGIDSVSANGFVCFALSPPAAPIEIVEFFNTGLGHYFMTGDKAEIASIESGGAGPGWLRTGERLTGVAGDSCTQPRNPAPLFRFYGTRGIGPNSHFFTADRAECGKARRDPGWTFESMPFRVWAPSAGACPPHSAPVHRLFNNRAAQNDSNHRYTTRQAIVDSMVASGWTHEGVTLCIPQP